MKRKKQKQLTPNPWFYRTIRLLTWISILCVMFSRFYHYYTTKNPMYITEVAIQRDQTIIIWKYFRNIIWIVLLIDIIYKLPRLLKQSNGSSYFVLKNLKPWFFSLLFITFSYAIAGLLVDITLIILLGLKMNGGINLLP